MRLTPYRAALVDIDRHYRARATAAVPVAMTYASPTNGFGPELSPYIDPCAKGHSLTVRNGWLVCAVCGTVLGKA